MHEHTRAQQLVEGLAGMLGLQKVGWIFSHPTREKGYETLRFCPSAR